jgi:hypothetical protein
MLPVAYKGGSAKFPGVRGCSISIFVDLPEQKRMRAAALDVDKFLDIIPDLKVPLDQREAMRRTRTV